MLKDKKAAIFDLDGTLVDSMGIWKDIDVEYLGKLHLEVPEDLQQDIEGLSFSEVAVYFKKRFGLKESVDFIKNEWNRMAMDKYLYEVPAKDGAVEFVRYLYEHGFKLGVASSNSVQLVDAALRAHGIRSFFSAVLTCCEVKKGKPEPDVYLEVARRLQVEPKDCVVFEDIPVGIMAGKAAGMVTCAVEDSYSAPYRQEKRKLADYYIDSYQDIFNGTFEEL
ncbi:MAG: HAD family phosphatase [Eubacteriales bacterium]|nr:HAD family phosphatase [Eubacteriales bacterium]